MVRKIRKKNLPSLLAITPGEPAGIGPDIVLQLAAKSLDFPCVIIADKNLLQQRAKKLGLDIKFGDYNPQQPAFSSEILSVFHVPLNAPCIPQQLNSANAEYVLNCLRIAVDGCLNHQFHALITGPVHKGIINQAGINFSGHTEFLAKLTQSPLPIMLMVTEHFRTALLTTHIPLAKVSAAITEQKLIETIRVLAQGLEQRFGITKPRIAVCGLNPHAGEGGYLGTEEIDIINPTLSKLRQQGYQVLGSLPADTAFTPQALQQSDVILAMYHDQALPVVKAQSFSTAVNVTLGLPIIRTSVDHGTALELAGSGQADPSSLQAAIQLASILQG